MVASGAGGSTTGAGAAGQGGSTESSTEPTSRESSSSIDDTGRHQHDAADPYKTHSEVVLLRKRARAANMLIRLFFLLSLIIIGGLVIATFITTTIGLNYVWSDANSLGQVSTVRFWSQVIVAKSLAMLTPVELGPTNVTLNDTVNTLSEAGAILQNGLNALQYGDSSSVLYPISNSNTTAEYAIIDPLAAHIVGDIDNITYLVNAGEDYVTPDMVVYARNIVATQTVMLTHLVLLEQEIQSVLQSTIYTVRIELYVFLSIILFVLLLLAVCFYIPLELRNRKMLNALALQNEHLDKMTIDLSDLTRLSPVGTFRTNHLGQLVYVNDRWWTILNLPRDMDPNDWVKFMEPEDVLLLQANIQRALLETCKSVQGEVRVTRMGRTSWIFVETFAELTTLVDGTVVVKSLVGAIMDITERKRLEQEQLAAFRQAAEAERQRAMEAERHRKAQVGFIDMICHEIRNPLNGIVNNIDLLMDEREEMIKAITSTDNTPSEIIQQIVVRLRNEEPLLNALDLCLLHQRRVTDDVLHISRLQDGQMQRHDVNFRLRDLIAGVMAIYKAEANKSGIGLAACFSDRAQQAPDVLCADSHRVAQVLINLVGNALKFTRSRPVRRVQVQVDLQPLPDQNNPPGAPESLRLVVGVSDSGIGISPEEMQRLFMQFSQANVRTYSRYGGSGMGLFLCRAMMDLLGGTIGCTSVVDEGSTFTIELPVVVAPAGAPIEASSLDIKAERRASAQSFRGIPRAPSSPIPIPPYVPAPSPPAEPSAVAREREKERLHVLVAEDNDINQMILRKQLESVKSVSVVVTIAHDGKEALDVFKAADPPFDVVLMDVEMPVMDGLQSTIEMREFERASQRTPAVIIGISGNAREEHAQLGKQAGMTDYLNKPVRRPELLASLQRLLQRTIA